MVQGGPLPIISRGPCHSTYSGEITPVRTFIRTFIGVIRSNMF